MSIPFLGTKKTELPPEVATAQEFVNIRDIIGGRIISSDGRIFAVTRITPISIDLKTQAEKKLLARQLTAEFAGDAQPFKLTAVSRPLDLSAIMDELTECAKNSDDANRREVIRREKQDIINYMMDGAAITRQFFITIWGEDAHELSRRASELVERFSHCKINAELLTDEELVRFCHVFANPDENAAGADDFAAIVPLLED